MSFCAIRLFTPDVSSVKTWIWRVSPLMRFILHIWASSGRVYALYSFTARVLFAFGDFYKCESKPPDPSLLQSYREVCVVLRPFTSTLFFFYKLLQTLSNCTAKVFFGGNVSNCLNCVFFFLRTDVTEGTDVQPVKGREVEEQVTVFICVRCVTGRKVNHWQFVLSACRRACVW